MVVTMVEGDVDPARVSDLMAVVSGDMLAIRTASKISSLTWENGPWPIS
jgi:hypothetical protein